MFSFAAKWRNREFSSFCGRAWAQFSCCLQRSVSQSILLRVDGQEFSRSPAVIVRPVFNVRSAPVVAQGAALPRESAAPAALPAVVLLPAPVLPGPVSPVALPRSLVCLCLSLLLLCLLCLFLLLLCLLCLLLLFRQVQRLVCTLFVVMVCAVTIVWRQ